MTKIRKPTSIHAAIFTICEFIGWDYASDVCRSESGQPLSTSQIRKYTDPDDPREISAINGARLDIAYYKKGGVGFPFSEAIQAKILRECEIDNCDDSLAEMIGNFALEGGQAMAAVLDKTKRQHEKSKEVGEAVEAALTLHNRLEVK